jgi:glycosyltransferase involved in cell wall biosynthesis
MPRFTVLLPVHRPPALLPFAIETVLAQEVDDFELFVICDGAPAETAACARDYARRDKRVRVFTFAKGERHGEAYRHQALTQAGGELVAQIADDDLWLPNHLGELSALLAEADFGHTIHTIVDPGGAVQPYIGDLARPELRARMLTEPFNFFGPSAAGYWLAAYRRLETGWSPAPADVWTDLHMWRKFLCRDDLVFATRMIITTLSFPAPQRADMTLAARAEELRAWSSRLAEPGERATVIEAAWRRLMRDALDGEAALAEMTAAHAELADAHRRILASRSWRTTAPLRTAAGKMRRLARALTTGRG